MSTEDVNKDKLVTDFKVVLADAEELLRATAAEAGEKFSAARARLEEKLASAKVKLREAEGVLMEKSKAAARATDDYVHAHPWKAVGIGAGIGLIIGLLIGRR
ncbi:MAG: DUF883 family protein [Burkholderiales bacterium]